MKRITYILLVSFLSLNLIAQETAVETSTTATTTSSSGKLLGKKDIPILPSTGDIAIGVDVMPYINFLGNTLNGDSGNSLDLSDQTTLYGKYYLASDAAVKAILNIQSSNTKERVYVTDDAAVAVDPASNAQVENERHTKSNSWFFGVGYVQTRGYGRLRGNYGLEVGYGVMNETTEYTHGNEMTTANPNPTSSFGSLTGGQRLLTEVEGTTHTFGAGITGGVEYFFLPKICIGGEIGLYFNYSIQRQSNHKYEQIQGDRLLEFDVEDSPGDRSWDVSTKSYNTNIGDLSTPSGRLYVLFHF